MTDKEKATEKLRNFIDWFSPTLKVKHEADEALNIVLGEVTENGTSAFDEFMQGLSDLVRVNIYRHGVNSFGELFQLLKNEAVWVENKADYEEVSAAFNTWREKHS